MTELFETKLRRIGNSLGIIIPNSLIQGLGFADGDLIQVAIPCSDMSTRNIKLAGFIGVERGKGKFKREKGDRY